MFIYLQKILVDLDATTSDLNTRTGALEEATVDQETRLIVAEENIQGKDCLRSRFSQTHIIGNIDIIANFVSP